MTETESLAILAVVGTLLGAAVGVIGTYFVSIRLARNHAKTIAGLRLRDAFSPELARLQTSNAFGVTEIPDMLKAGLSKHQAAVNEFRFFLKGRNLKSFNQTWDKYKEDEDFVSHMVEPDGGGPDSAIKAIEAILNFTND